MVACVSSRHAGLDLNCELCIGCLDVVLHMTPRLNFGWLRLKHGLLYMVVVLTFAVIAPDTASIVDHDLLDGFTICLQDFLFVVILVRDSPSFSSLLQSPCKFQSSSPGHIVSIVGLLPILLRHVLAFVNLLDFVVRVGCLLRCDFLRCLDRAFGFCSMLFVVSPLKLPGLLMSIAKDLIFFTVFSMLVKR